MGTTSNIVVTGLGFKPRLVKLTSLPTTAGTYIQLSTGAMTADKQYCSSIGGSMSGSTTAGGRSSSTSAVLQYLSSTNGSVTTTVSKVSLDSDGFTIKCDNTSFAYDVAYEAWQ